MADKKVIVTIEGKESFAKVDIDSDLLSQEPLHEQLSTRVKNCEDGGKDFYVTDIFDLMSNCKTVKIEKL